MRDQIPDSALTPGRLLALKRVASHPDWPAVWRLLCANFPLDESIFVNTRATGRMDYLDAAKRDGQRDVLLYIRKSLELPTPAEDEPEKE